MSVAKHTAPPRAHRGQNGSIHSIVNHRRDYDIFFKPSPCRLRACRRLLRLSRAAAGPRRLRGLPIGTGRDPGRPLPHRQIDGVDIFYRETDRPMRDRVLFHGFPTSSICSGA